MVKNQSCIGVFIMFTCKRLLWVIKDKGESWISQYFRDIILTQNVFPFLKTEDNVIDPDEVIFVHDKAPCMRANETQHLLQNNDVKFCGNDIWPGNSPDLIVAEHIESIIKGEVEKKSYRKLDIIDIMKTHLKCTSQMFQLAWKKILNYLKLSMFLSISTSCCKQS
jgi:hypothetical protein